MNVLNALARVSGMTLLSRVLGLIRDLVIARVFGAELVTDAFFVAFSAGCLRRALFLKPSFPS